MRRWVVTGPTGAGKSAVTALLAARGAVVVDGDRLGHELLASPAVAAAVAARFGEAVLDGGGVHRGRLGRLVFGDPQALADLDGIIHGPLGALMAARLADLEEAGTALAVLEAAVYFRLPAPPRADLVVAVLAAPEARAARLAARAGLDLTEALARVRALAHLDRDWSRADVTIRNDGSAEELAATVARLWADQSA